MHKNETFQRMIGLEAVITREDEANDQKLHEFVSDKGWTQNMLVEKLDEFQAQRKEFEVESCVRIIHDEGPKLGFSHFIPVEEADVASALAWYYDNYEQFSGIVVWPRKLVTAFVCELESDAVMIKLALSK